MHKTNIKRKLTAKHKLIILFSSFIILLVGIILYLNYIVNPIIILMTEAKVKSLATQAVSRAISETIKEDLYTSLVEVKEANDGTISFISTNAIEINRLTRQLTQSAQKNLETIGEQGINIPIGSFTGMPIFVGRGPTVKVNIMPIGSISSHFVSLFSSAGINQTNHRIYVNIGSSVSVVLPTANKTVSTETQVLICESILIGAIPETYLYSDSLDEMMNLIPN